MKLFGAVCALSLIAAGAARADIVPACPAPVGVTEVAFDQIPMGIMKALHDKTGDMAMPGQPFNATDVGQIANGKAVPSSRGLFAWSLGTRWVIATEHGGRGYNDPIYVFDVAADGKRVRLTAGKSAGPNTVCAVAKGLAGAQ